MRAGADTDVSSSYLKNESQTWASRPRPSKKARHDADDANGADGADGVDGVDGADGAGGADAADDDGPAQRLVIHLGSEFLRVGRAPDLYPIAVPAVLARRRVPRRRAPRAAASAAPEAELERLRAELRAIMRQYKLRPVSQGVQSAQSYNASVKPERIAEHNDVYDVGYVDDAEVRGDVVVGHDALRLASLAAGEEASPWTLCRPWHRGLLDVDGYAALYGDACIEALLGDVQALLTHALTAPAAASGGGGLGLERGALASMSVLLCVPDSFSRSDVRALAHVLFRHMGIAALHVQTEGLCATFGAGLSAACVVDLGATSIGVSCIEEGLVLPDTRIALRYGGRDMTRFFGEVVRASQFPYHELDERRQADATLLNELKEKYATLQPSQVGLNLYDFTVRLPHAPALKYAWRLYDEPILAGLMLFHPEVVRDVRLPRRAWTSASEQVAPPEDTDANSMLTAANPSLGGDEAAELQPASLLDVAPTLAMLGCVAAQLPDSVWPLLDPSRVPAESTASPAPSPAPAPASAPAPAPAAAPASAAAAAPARGAPAVPQTSAMATAAAKSLCAAQLAAQHGVDVLSASGTTPLDRAVFQSLLASTGSLDGALSSGAEERLRRLANNIVCIGGAARIPGLAEALEARVSMLLAEHYVPSDPAKSPAVCVPAAFSAPQAVVIPPPRKLDPACLAWKGLAVLAHLDVTQEGWVHAGDWDTLGYRALKEKSLFL